MFNTSNKEVLLYVKAIWALGKTNHDNNKIEIYVATNGCARDTK